MRDAGRVDVLMHAPGLEISHFLPDKPQREYDLVFDVKGDGWLNLLRALRGNADRHGGRLQLDRRPLRQRRPDRLPRRQRPAVQEHLEPASTRRARAASPSTGPPGPSIGMASRGSIPKMMEMAGIDMLPPELGVPVVRRELTAAGDGGEVVVAGALGVLPRSATPTGGLDPDAAARGGGSAGADERADRVHDVGTGLTVLHRARPQPPGVPGRPPHRRHPGAARRDGHGGRSPRPRTPCCPAGTSSRSRTSSCWRRSSSTATSRARSSCARWCATAATARSWPTAELIGRRALPGPGRAGDRALHRPRAPAKAPPPAPPRAREPERISA